MQKFNMVAIALTALIPAITGMIYYHPKLVGKYWMRETGVTEDSGRKGMAVKVGVSLVFSFFLAFNMNFIVVHQYHLFSMLANQQADLANPESPLSKTYGWLMSEYGHNFRTYKHGALHGALAGLFFAVPILGTAALFENRTFKYIAISAGYWIPTLALMGAVISHFAA